MSYTPNQSKYLTVAQTRTNRGTKDVKIILDVDTNVFYTLDDDNNFIPIAYSQSIDASAVSYDNINSGLNATNVQNGIDELSLIVEAEGGLKWSYNKSRNQNFAPINFVSTTNATSGNILRFFPIVIKEDLDITEFGVNITVGAVGNMVLGLYDAVDGIPNNLLFQSAPLDTNVTGTQFHILSSPYSIKKGVYFKALNSNSAPTLTSIPQAAHDNVLGCLNNSGALQTEARYALTYTGTLPAIAGATTNRFNASSIEVLFKIS